MKNKHKKIVIMLLLAALQTASMFAGNTITFGYDAAGNRNVVNSPISCLELGCPCPDNTDGWLVFEAIPQEPPSTDCDITAHLNIPEEYSDCYSLGIYTGDFTSFRNAQKIMLGNFYIDENQTFFGGVYEGVSAHTFQMLQNSVGSAFQQWINGNGGVDRVDYFDGATFTTNENKKGGGISLGKFIHCWYDGEIEGSFKAFVLSNPKYMHEYGHYLDSKKLGHSYLFNIAIPSLWSAIVNGGQYHDGDYWYLSKHDTFWTELRANRRAYIYFTKEHHVNWNKYTDEYPLYWED